MRASTSLQSIRRRGEPFCDDVACAIRFTFRGMEVGCATMLEWCRSLASREKEVGWEVGSVGAETRVGAPSKEAGQIGRSLLH